MEIYKKIDDNTIEISNKRIEKISDYKDRLEELKKNILPIVKSDNLTPEQQVAIDYYNNNLEASPEYREIRYLEEKIKTLEEM